MDTDQAGIWRNLEFRTYLGSVAFSGVAFAMQQLLLSWILIGILELPAAQVGVIQAVAGIPGIFLMLLGGASADQRDPRLLLIGVYTLAPILPLLLAVFISLGYLNVWTVLLWALGMAVVTAYSSPAQQAILNRIAGKNVQKAVSASTVIGSLVQMLGVGLAGQIDSVGLPAMLVAQGLCVGIGALAVRRIRAVPAVSQSAGPAWRTIGAGFRAVYAHKVIFQTLVVNSLSSIFNAGAFLTVFPFIIKRIYDGNAAMLGVMLAVFYGCAMCSNLLMLRLMPFERPGRIYLVLQLSRLFILGLLWFQPSLWLVVAAIMAWGFNMGVTTTLSRTIVQESATPEFRGRIMSVYSLGLLGSAPIGALVLGWIIEVAGTLNALLPAMVVSVCLFVYGVIGTDIFAYRSPSQRSSAAQGENI